MREIRTETLGRLVLGTGYSFTQNCVAMGDPITVCGPAVVRLVVDREIERRVAAGQRRARGTGGALYARRLRGDGYGRRAGDTAAHKERRNASLHVERRNPAHVNGVPAKYNPLGQWRLGRKTDERRDPSRGITPAAGCDLRRRAGEERRGPGSKFRHYRNSADSRIVALERRKS